MRTSCLMLVCLVAGVALGSADARGDKLATRSMDDLNWREFQKLVPAQVDLVLLTVGTLEPHGVVNNGADNTAPVALARALAEDVNGLIAPHIPYGVTGALAPYPGALHIPEDVFRAYVRAVLVGLVRTGLRKIVILNGHGGPQTDILEGLAREVALETGAQTLVIQWWKLASDITMEVFGEDGGHAGVNETAFIQALNNDPVPPEIYTGADMATANPPKGAWSATPFPSTIGLYTAGQGLPKDFDQKKADEYFRRVVGRVGALIKDTVRKWRLAGFR